MLGYGWHEALEYALRCDNANSRIVVFGVWVSRQNDIATKQTKHQYSLSFMRLIYSDFLVFTFCCRKLMHVLSFNFDGVESMRLENAQRTKYFLHEIIELDAPYFSFLSICDLFGFSLIFLLLFMVLEGVSQIENDFLRFCKESRWFGHRKIGPKYLFRASERCWRIVISKQLS